MAIPQSKIQEISDRTSMVEIVNQYTSLKPSGNGFTGICPFHSEKTPSFSVDEDKKLYYCFGCHKGGNLFQFIMDVESLSFAESVKFLGQKAGIEIIENEEESRQNSQLTALYELYERVSGTFNYLLTRSRSGTGALQYLINRGISEESIKQFNLGYAPDDPDWLFSFLRKKGYSADFLNQSGLFSRRNNTFPLFRDRLMIPIYSSQGRVIAFGGRLLNGDGPKYLNSPETPIFKKSKTLYGFNFASRTIRQERQFYLCEGYMDVIALHQADIKSAIAPLGTSFTSEQAVLLKRYADKGMLLFDADEAGQRAAEKAIMICAKAGTETFVVRPEGGKDPAEILQKEGKEALQNSLKYNINSFDYLVEKAMGRFNAGTPEGKHRILKELSPFIEIQDSAIKREGYMKRLSETLEVNVTAITADLSNQTIRTQHVRENVSDPEQIGPDLFLMLGAAAYPDQFKNIRSYITADDLVDPRSRELYIILENAFRRDELDMNSIVQKVDNENVRQLVLEKAFSGEFGEDPAGVIKDVLRAVRLASLEKRQKAVSIQLKRAERNGAAGETLRDILTEKMYLTEELQKLRVGRK